MSLPHVVILGGGFGGLYAARSLARVPVRITVVDERNHHLFQPLLYQVATAALNPSDIAAPIRSILRRQKNVSVILARAVRIDPRAKKVFFVDGEIGYDYLIVATGATHSYFGHSGWAEHAPGLKSIEDALEIRRRMLLAYEAAEREPDPARQEEWLTFVIVGGGPTGVELAGAIAEISRHTLGRDFRNFDPRKTRVLLFQEDRILPTFPESLSEKAARQLKRLGVMVRTGARVTGIDGGGIWVGSERVKARTVIWAAGVKASTLGASLGVPLDNAGRVIVNPELTIPGHPELFVIGDLASFTQDGKPVPGVAPAAMQEARHAAENIARALRGEPYKTFRYVDKGMLAAIGRAAAVADVFGKIRLSGWVAWIAWLAIHIFFLIGFRNRFAVIFEWAWAYLTYERGARLITGDIREISAPLEK